MYCFVLFLLASCSSTLQKKLANTDEEGTSHPTGVASSEEPTEEFTEEPQEEFTEEIQEESTEETPEESIEETQEEPPEKPVVVPLDYSQLGPYPVTRFSGTANVSNCTFGMEYVAFSPQGSSSLATMVLGHGFLRGGDKMHGWAEHYASWGIEVLTPNLCHYNVLFGVDHEMNAQNMVELATERGATSVIYAGQSAGGLAAIIAASQDNRSIGVLGLDATDTEGAPSVPDFIGQGYAASISSPSYALTGEPSTCNSNNNGVTLFEMMDSSQILRVASSDHCDYEKPTDWACETLCLNDTTVFSEEEISSVITHLSTAAALALSGDSSAKAAWDDTNIDLWKASGLLLRLQ